MLLWRHWKLQSVLSLKDSEESVAQNFESWLFNIIKVIKLCHLKNDKQYDKLIRINWTRRRRRTEIKTRKVQHWLENLYRVWVKECWRESWWDSTFIRLGQRKEKSRDRTKVNDSTHFLRLCHRKESVYRLQLKNITTKMTSPTIQTNSWSMQPLWEGVMKQSVILFKVLPVPYMSQ